MDACYQRCKEAEEAADDFTRHQSTALLILFYKTLKTKTKKNKPHNRPRTQIPKTHMHTTQIGYLSNPHVQNYEN